MTMEVLFGKLLTYEHELTQQSYAKETKKKRKGIALKVNSSREEYKDSSNSEEDAKNFNLMVRKLGKFLRKSKDGKSSKTSKKIENNNSYTCFECGKHGHIKSKYSIYLRKHGEKRSKNDIKQKKAYIAWEDNASTTSDSSSDEEIANVCLMEKSMNDLSTSEEVEVNSDFEELVEAFNEMHEEAQRLVVLNKKLKSKLKLHINKLASTQGELNVLKQENEKLVSRCKATACDDTYTSFNMDDYKFLQTIYLRKHGEKRAKKDIKQKKAYIAWEDNGSTTSDSSSDEEIANVCLMEKSMNDLSTSEEVEVNPDFEELVEAFNEMHEEAQRLVVLNKKLKSKLELHINKLASTQGELNVLSKKMKSLFQDVKPLHVMTPILPLTWMITSFCKLSLKISKRITMLNV